ncbi:MAG: phosphatidate cytidylyltransferase [Oscillospiraceae bacterium]|nr:phosphatidate cytidylyltransferase [Oscillospiraceae bacterium]MCL2279760.1 phosphatidate cytidylyltransferase [Oscillospiraceae bacterium]
MKTRILAALVLLPIFLAILIIFPPIVLAITLVVICTLIAIELFRAGKEAKFTVFRIFVSFLGIIPIPLALSSLYWLRVMPWGQWLVLFPVIVTIFTDSGAYFVGVSMGRRKAFPNISPNKTIEGCIGGIIIGTVGIFVYGLIIQHFTGMTVSIPVLLTIGLVGSVITEIGDLAFSLLKRKLGIKDYGNLIPGHGGMLDRFDSMIFSAPMVYLLFIIL